MAKTKTEAKKPKKEGKKPIVKTTKKVELVARCNNSHLIIY